VLEIAPDFAAFKAAYDGGLPQVAHLRLVDDLETPVSAYLKIGHGRPYAFLFESVEGGTWRGRYSIITLDPDLVWRCRGNQAEVAEGEDIAAGRFRTQSGGALDSLRDLVAASRIELPPGMPPMAGGVFGAIGYDMIRLVERLPVVPMPAWRTRRTTPIDERDMIELLARAATAEQISGLALDVGGAEEVTYRELIERISELLLLGRPTLGLGRLTVTPIASRVAAAVASEDYELIGPLMESLATDLLASDTRAADLMGVRLHSLDAAIEHALGEWEATEPLAAR